MIRYDFKIFESTFVKNFQLITMAVTINRTYQTKTRKVSGSWTRQTRCLASKTQTGIKSLPPLARPGLLAENTQGKGLFRENIKSFFFCCRIGFLATRERYVPGKFSYKRELLPGGGQYCPPDKVLLPQEKIIKR